MRHIDRMVLALAVSVMAIPQAIIAESPNWLNIFMVKDNKQGVTSVPVDSISNLSFRKTSVNSDYYDILEVARIDGSSVNVAMDYVSEYTLGTNVPTVHITTNPSVSEISSKSEYLTGSFAMECFGDYEAVAATAVNIRGRGNTTWSYSKKPYRLKFDKKISLCGMKKAKNYVLIANYLDNTLMKNAVAFKVGQLLGMPYTNHSVPVNVVLNGVYRGSYMLSEKVGINSGSIDIDEEKGILWELDSYYDEDYRFRSPIYNLPVMVKDPDFTEIASPSEGQSMDEAIESLLGKWKADFLKMERAVKDRTPETCIDMEQAVNYMLASSVVRNPELNWPKSTYMFKAKEEDLYSLGPLWDYDWAFNFQNQSYSWPLLVDEGLSKTGTRFFLDLVKSNSFQQLFKEKWQYFKTELYPVLLEYIDYYADMVRVSALQDAERWPGSGPDGCGYSCERFDADVATLKDWVIHRIEFIDTDAHHGFY